MAIKYQKKIKKHIILKYILHPVTLRRIIKNFQWFNDSMITATANNDAYLTNNTNDNHSSSSSNNNNNWYQIMNDDIIKTFYVPYSTIYTNNSSTVTIAESTSSTVFTASITASTTA